ncbi:protein YIPF6, putative [Hepatocystis sp. ex Piliocolobus tephrosceles]|nr:protein YIPF6, putative [Hepatocystis sp. ex Piliocolobus tephrosceles]
MATQTEHITNFEFTMDEPVKDTVIRDVKSIYKKIQHICFHKHDNNNDIIKKWDMWGFLIIYMSLAVIIFLDKEIQDNKKTFAHFSIIFIIGNLLVSLNLSLLNINIYFFQTLCTVSYSLFPMVFSAFVNLFVSSRMIRFLFFIMSTTWSSYNCILVLGKFIKSNKLLISILPICLLQFFLTTLLLIK